MKKSELRMGITQNVQKMKGSVALEELYQITGILTRKYDDKEFETLTDEEWDRASIISSAIRISNPKSLRRIKNMCRHF